jgi:hypothetical protein
LHNCQTNSPITGCSILISKMIRKAKKDAAAIASML